MNHSKLIKLSDDSIIYLDPEKIDQWLAEYEPFESDKYPDTDRMPVDYQCYEEEEE